MIENASRIFRKVFSLKFLPFYLIFLTTSVYFIYILNDSRYFFVDDFTGFQFSVERSYEGIIKDSLISRNVDRHKFIGYMTTKFLYQTVGLNLNDYFLTLFLIHTTNCFLLYLLILRISKKKIISTLLTLVFAYRFYLWWFSNIHALLAGLFMLLGIHSWLLFIENKERIYYIAFLSLYPLMVFSYGPTILLPVALAAVSWFKYGFTKTLNYFKFLIPLFVLVIAYLFYFTFTQDSMIRFVESTNPYMSDFSLMTYLKVQAIYLSLISGGLIPSSVMIMIIFWGFMYSFTFLKCRKNTLLLAAFHIALLANSFFVQHTMFYYLYQPIVFLLLYFGEMFKTKYWVGFLIIFFVLFNPFYEMNKVFFRLRHPAVNFEVNAMKKITTTVDNALNNDLPEVQLSNWEVTPNIAHCIDNQVLPLFLSSDKKNSVDYIYDKNQAVLKFVKKNQ